MRSGLRELVVGSLCFGFSTTAFADGWQLVPPSANHGAQLTYNLDSLPSYILECGASDVIVSQLGVTELLDVQTNQKISDEPGSTMTPGAAFMALYTDRVEPELVSAEASPNSVRGWNMTIRIPKKDRAFRSLPKADLVSIFTTGYTMAVTVDDASRTVLKNFVSACRS